MISNIWILQGLQKNKISDLILELQAENILNYISKRFVHVYLLKKFTQSNPPPFPPPGIVSPPPSCKVV